jgi:3-oxoisoapionate kinase
VLFLEPPSPEQLRRFEGVQAIGVAGVSRSLPTAQMEAELLPVFRALRELGAPLVHYKVCSTFDSSPETGSIGRAIDLGQEVFGSPHVPVVVGAPRLGRYTAFGNLFARSGPESEVFRLDRHPTMSHHPTTPMHESDLRIHLARQTDREIGLLDLVQISAPDDLPEEHHAAVLDSGAEVVLFDVLYEGQLSTIGALIWNRTMDAPLFAVGSSGLGYALVAHWQETDMLTEPQGFEALRAVDRLVVVSGSCSPVTGRQISEAVENGFVGVPLNPAQLLDSEEMQEECERAVREVWVRWRAGAVSSCTPAMDQEILG